jgi:hypothetical protein
MLGCSCCVADPVGLGKAANSQDISEDMRFSGAGALLTAPRLPISGKDTTQGSVLDMPKLAVKFYIFHVHL